MTIKNVIENKRLLLLSTQHIKHTQYILNFVIVYIHLIIYKKIQTKKLFFHSILKSPSICNGSCLLSSISSLFIINLKSFILAKDISYKFTKKTQENLHQSCQQATFFRPGLALLRLPAGQAKK